MISKDRLTTIYANARELVKQNHPQAAKSYVGLLLKAALHFYHNPDSIITKAKTAVFMEKWIAVARDLQEYGVTDYVLECFGLPFNMVAGRLMTPPSSIVPLPKSPEKSEAKPTEKKPTIPDTSFSTDASIDIEGLIEESAKSQGWCADIFEKNKTAVVGISVSSSTGAACGTGFVISENGYLLTNDHVVYDEVSSAYYPKIKMTRIGEKKTHLLELLFSDKKADVALCRFDPDAVKGITSVKRVANYSELVQGADCLVIGNAFGMGLAPFTGVVRFTKDSEGDLVYTAPSNPGDSGGPVFNRRGEAIGINKSRTLKFNGAEADAYANATPMSKIDALLENWTKHNNIHL